MHSKSISLGMTQIVLAREHTSTITTAFALVAGVACLRDVSEVAVSNCIISTAEQTAYLT